MGIVWEAYHKGVPLLGVPENPIDLINHFFSANGKIIALDWCFGILWKYIIPSTILTIFGRDSVLRLM